MKPCPHNVWHHDSDRCALCGITYEALVDGLEYADKGEKPKEKKPDPFILDALKYAMGVLPEGEFASIKTDGENWIDVKMGECNCPTLLDGHHDGCPMISK